MSTDEALEKIITSLEENPVEIEEFYEGMSEYYPTAVGWLTDRSDPLTAQEEDYILFLGMIILTLIAGRELEEPSPDQLASAEEKIWEQLNEDHPGSMEAQANKVDDADDIGIFLIDAFHADEELPFLTPPGALAGYARLYSLSKAFDLL